MQPRSQGSLLPVPTVREGGERKPENDVAPDVHLKAVVKKKEEQQTFP